MIKQAFNGSQRGFTLIELLIVIMIIGILAGVLLSVINPTQQRIRAQEATMRANVSKLCMAWAACKNSSPSGAASDCSSFGKIGADVPTTPNGATYSYTSSRFQGYLASDTCTIYCNPSTNLPTLSSCSIAQ